MQRERLDFLDNLRGVAALYVLLFHVYRVLTPNLAPPPAIAPLIGFGYSGVWLFFAISAFSLSLTMPRHIATGIPLMSFAASRFFRIAPLFYVLIIYSTLHYCLTTGKPPEWELIVGSISFLFNLVPTWSRSAVSGGWAIGAEAMFYATFPLLYFFAKGVKTRLIIFFAALIVYVIFANHFSWLISNVRLWERFEARSIVRFFPSFMMGLLVFDAYAALKGSSQAKLFGSGALIAGMLLFAWQVSVGQGWGILHQVHVDTIAYALILLGAALCRPRVLASRILSYYGRISYSIYLWHIPVIVLIGPFLHTIYAVEAPQWFRFAAVSAIVLGLATVVAHISYRVIERPAEEYGKRLVERLSEARHRAAFRHVAE
ncbi:acyltransferase family protein [Microvirga lotononidis]|uniref:Putative acyltransferase n=1 Tax=Microvirga lotononidis TaxID=864069 RepID=I4YNQ0_9HYPH|nr:acyltransferase [Microvirga lotononidis]EIM25592.1 putative acyltransferase [Microvirga lotononidis]WQO26103.1 acyltransferase [Microvirga lotononidis]